LYPGWWTGVEAWDTAWPGVGSWLLLGSGTWTGVSCTLPPALHSLCYLPTCYLPTHCLLLLLPHFLHACTPLPPPLHTTAPAYFLLPAFTFCYYLFTLLCRRHSVKPASWTAERIGRLHYFALRVERRDGVNWTLRGMRERIVRTYDASGNGRDGAAAAVPPIWRKTVHS